MLNLTALCIALLLWQAVRLARSRRDVLLLPVVFASAYIVAFFLVGLLGFHGFLNDFHLASADFVKAVLRVWLFLFGLYAIATALFYALDRALRVRKQPSNPSS